MVLCHGRSPDTCNIFSSTLVQALLKEHANDDPKLSYTGEPIVRWPERVRRHKFLQTFSKLGIHNSLSLHSDDYICRISASVVFNLLFFLNSWYWNTLSVLSSKIKCHCVFSCCLITLKIKNQWAFQLMAMAAACYVFAGHNSNLLFLFVIPADVTHTANMVPAPNSSSPCPLPSSLGPHPPQASRSEVHQTLLHLCPEAQTGEMQALCCLLQEGVWHLPLLPRHEEVWRAWTHEEGLYHETVSSSELEYSSSSLYVWKQILP